MSETKIKCSCCGKERVLTEYYSSNSPIHRHHGKLAICKKCLLGMVDYNDIRSITNMLRMCDRPFLAGLYEISVEEASKTRSNPFQIYMKNIVMRQYRDRNWEDSEFDVEYIESELSRQTDIDKDVLERWRGYSEEKIIILEDKYQELINAYEHDTPIQRNIYRNIAVAQMQADEAINNGKTADFQKMMKVVSDLMNDAKIKPLQDTGVDDKGLNTWGEWVKKIEETEPIPEATDEFKDVDGIHKYIDTWFVGHMKKVFGLADTTEADADVFEDGDKQ